MTKAMAIASASGRCTSAVNIAPIPAICSSVRSRISRRTWPETRQGRAVIQTSGNNNSA